MKNLYCIYDGVAESSSEPFVAVNDGIALRFARSFVDRSISDSSVFNPVDFSLYRIGTFEDSGLPSVVSDSVFICKLDTLVVTDSDRSKVKASIAALESVLLCLQNNGDDVPSVISKVKSDLLRWQELDR